MIRVSGALKANNLLEAIKLYRMATNASLEAAKAGVEEMRARLGIWCVRVTKSDKLQFVVQLTPSNPAYPRRKPGLSGLRSICR
jgi:hypothetical protein